MGNDIQPNRTNECHEKYDIGSLDRRLMIKLILLNLALSIGCWFYLIFIGEIYNGSASWPFFGLLVFVCIILAGNLNIVFSKRSGANQMINPWCPLDNKERNNAEKGKTPSIIELLLTPVFYIFKVIPYCLIAWLVNLVPNTLLVTALSLPIMPFAGDSEFTIVVFLIIYFAVLMFTFPFYSLVLSILLFYSPRNSSKINSKLLGSLFKNWKVIVISCFKSSAIFIAIAFVAGFIMFLLLSASEGGSGYGAYAIGVGGALLIAVGIFLSLITYVAVVSMFTCNTYIQVIPKENTIAKDDDNFAYKAPK